MAEFSVYHLTYLTFLIFGYGVFRTKTPMINVTTSLLANQGEAKVVLFVTILLEVYFQILGSPERSSLPHFVWQITNVLASIKFIFTLYFAEFAFANWQHPLMKMGIVAYLSLEIYSLLAGNAGRTWLFLHGLAYTMLIHRLVRPLSFKVLSFLFLFALFTFIMGGFYRHGIWLASLIFFSFSGL